jgi:hypothetical protein
MKKDVVTEIQTIKTKLENYKEQNSKAKAQEEILLKQLKDEFEINTIDDALELYEQLTEENEERSEMIESAIEELKEKMAKDNLL